MDNTNNNSKISEDQDFMQYDDDFSLIDLANILSESKKNIALITSTFFIVSSLYTFFLPDVYTSDSLLTIADDSEAGGSGFASMASRYSGLVSMAGVTMTNGSSSKSDHIIATIKSRTFFEHLASIPGIYPPLVAGDSYDLKTKKLTLNQGIYNSVKGTWVNDMPSLQGSHYKYFVKNLVISADKKTGFIYLSFTHISPEFSLLMAQTIIKEANNIVRLQHIGESNKALAYLNNELKKTFEIGTKDSISTLIDAQLKVQMLANVRQDYIISPIDKPVLPEWKSGPTRIKIILLSTFVGLLISGFFALYAYYFLGKKR
jgi:capsule polysaccharide export protein KpsE/RkpR